MYITEAQLKHYTEEGYVLFPNAFSAEEMATLKAELPVLFAEESPRRVVEKNGQMVRSVYAPQVTSKAFERLARHPKLVYPATEIIGNKIYIHQFKINAKAAFGGDVWEWHQDYIFWKKEDGILQDNLVNIVLFLDEVTEFNGPMTFIPRTHKKGIINVDARSESLKSAQHSYSSSPAWISNLTADLKYALGKETISELVAQYGMVAPKGPAGTLLLFHGNIVHSSATNISPYDRTIALLTYNSIENTPTNLDNPRPDFLAGHDYRPIAALSEDESF
jgi:ectoine hydroxylase-related dioxygenase (phytanoyl-CoA dioxygenase family)